MAQKRSSSRSAAESATSKPASAARPAIVEPGTGKILAMVQNTRLPQERRQGPALHPGELERRPASTAARPASSSARRPRCSPSSRALQKGMPVNGTIPSKFATTKQAGGLHAQRDRGRCGAGTDCGRSATTSRSAASRSRSSWPPPSRSTPRSPRWCSSWAPPNVRKTMTTMGLHQGTGAPDRAATRPSSTLGAGDATPLTLAASYATLAAEGKYCAPEPDPVDHDGRQEADQDAGQPPASRSSTRTSPTARPSCSRASSRTAPAPGPSSGRPSRGRQDGHHRQPRRVVVRRLHRRSSPRPSGSAPPTARTGCATSRLAGAVLPARSSVARSRRRSGRTIMDGASKGLPDAARLRRPQHKVLKGDLRRASRT